MSTNVYERVIDLYERADGSFLVMGHPSPDLAYYEVKAYLDEALGKDGWHDLVIKRVSPTRGAWKENELTDDEWVQSDDGEPWAFVSTEYEMV